MSKGLVLLNLLLAAAAVAFSIQLIRVLFTPHPFSSPPVPHSVQAVVSPKEDPAPTRPPLAAYNVVATRNLFNPSRSEAVTQTESLAQASKPVLYGVLINGDTRLAYLEDPATKRVVAYKTGDALAGGQLERIETDRVVIKRAEGPLQIMLKDPHKPKPTVSEPTPPPGTASPAAFPPSGSIGLTPPPPQGWGGYSR